MNFFNTINSFENIENIKKQYNTQDENYFIWKTST